MSQIAVNKCSDWASIPQTVLDKIQDLSETIRQKAYNLFESRNGGDGSEVQDWLEAERDTVWVPTSELVESAQDLRAKIAVPGFDAKEIEVSATPDELIVRAEASHTHEGEKANVAFCEFTDKTLFRRFILPARIDVDKVSATLDKGILQIVAPKLAQQAAAA